MLTKQILKTTFFTSLALIAFAANSVICRLALGTNAIDASTFTIIRLLSGATVLLLIMKSSKKFTQLPSKGSWVASFMLFSYAITFSYAYISLDTGTGALILFGSVQITMIFISIIQGERLNFAEWIGIFTAFCGLVYLILPNVTEPSLVGFLLMTVSGISWGIYTIKGRGSKNPLMDTGYNFLRTIPFIIIITIFTINNVTYNLKGILLAFLSGAVTSGIGYTLWYMALNTLSSTKAAVLQLSVPVIAGAGGVIFVFEPITLRLSISTVLVIGGIIMVILGGHYFTSIKAGLNAE